MSMEKNEEQVYREMYCHMAHEMEKAIRILVKAQQECEELYLNAADGAEASDPAEPLLEKAQ